MGVDILFYLRKAIMECAEHGEIYSGSKLGWVFLVVLVFFVGVVF